MKTDQVFVSHTSDMAVFPRGRSFVQAVLDGVGRAGMAPVDMRFFAAQENKSAEYCRQRVRECEIYVAVVGFRYGSIVPGEAVSYTELEFNEASAAGLPRLVFLLEDTSDLPAGLLDVDRGPVESFRQRLLGTGPVVRTFSSDAGLELEVFHALKELTGSGPAVPRQLPAAVPHFVGRSAELTALDSLARESADSGGTVVIAAIGGTAGVGKTALAVHWAHQVAGRFPEGQLYVNLRGFDPGGQSMDPAEAVRGFLDALQVPPQRIPAGLDAQVGLYRSLLAGRRMLVVLDNARDSAQVRPLLPGTPGCLVLITSRNQLSGLVAAYGAQPIDLDVLSPGESRDLLTRRLGPGRVAAEPDAVGDIVDCCARLPLALAVVAARAAVYPRFSLDALATELRETRDRLDVFDGEDPATDVRAVLSWSYRALTPGAARLFRLLGLHPGPDISAPAAASLAGLRAAQVRPMLAELASAHLIAEHTPGRYAFHDLLRAYAAEQAGALDAATVRRDAIRRVLDHYLHTAHAAALLLGPGRDPLTLAPPHPGVTPEVIAGKEQAMAWFEAEDPVLLGAVAQAATMAFDTHAWQIPWTLATFLNRRGRWRDWEATQRTALAAARRLADPRAQALTHRLLAQACIQLGRIDDARSHLQQALDLYGEAGDQVGQARTHQSLAVVGERQGRYEEALAHAQQVLALYQRAGHRAGQADGLNMVGWNHAHLGDYDEALISCQSALELHRGLGNRLGEAATWDSLGYVHHHLGNYLQATGCYEQSLRLLRELGNRYEEAETLTRLGDTHHTAGDPAAARDHWQRALLIFDDLDHPAAGQVRAKLATPG